MNSVQSSGQASSLHKKDSQFEVRGQLAKCNRNPKVSEGREIYG